MGKSSKTPKAPNPTTTANAQAKYDQQTALYQAGLNNINQITPYGSETYTLQNTNPGTGAGSASSPQYTSTITLSPAQQQILDAQQNLQIQAQGASGTALGQFQSNLASPYSLSGLPQLANANDVSNQESTVTKSLLSRIQPQLDRDQEALDSKLANQGINVGSQAYNTAIQLQNQAKNDAYTQATLSGVQAGQIYNNEALANNQQAVSNYNQQYYAPLNTYNSLQGGVQVQNPTFQSPGNTQVANTDYSSLVQNAYQAKLNSANASNASSNALTGALFGLGGSFLGNPGLGLALGQAVAK